MYLFSKILLHPMEGETRPGSTQPGLPTETARPLIGYTLFYQKYCYLSRDFVAC